MKDEDEGTLDFAGALGELQGLIGRRVSVESGPEGAGPFHESRGVLERSMDLQITSGWPLDRPARVAFFLAHADAQFVVRESGFLIALAYTLELPEGPSRTVQLHYVGGAVLIVREELD
ncbi:MAG: hypothetical protein GEU88_07540 [Solirubrobacterales bacterium]|nr:hypothetical protein [Solirubrobacterales bacterium]